MKTIKIMKYKALVLSCLITFVLIQVISARKDEVKKEYHKEYKATKNSELVIENKFGNINVENWEKNIISIDVVISVDYPNKEKAEKYLGYIDVKFSTSGDEIKAITEFDLSSSWLSSDNFTREISIDYTVFLPKYISINLKNRHGSVIVDEITGRAVLEVKYGKLMANKLTRGNVKPLNHVIIGYSPATIEECNWLKIDIKHSKKLEISKSKAITLVSKHSKIYIENGSSIVAESRYDTWNIGHISNIVCSAGYTNFYFEEISKKISMKTNYSDCKIDYIPPDFKTITIESGYGVYKLGIDHKASYKLEGLASYGKIYYPETGNVSRISENTKLTVNGVVGTEKNTESKISIDTKYGNVRLYK